MDLLQDIIDGFWLELVLRLDVLLLLGDVEHDARDRNEGNVEQGKDDVPRTERGQRRQQGGRSFADDLGPIL